MVRLREKNGKVNEITCHHKLEEYLDAYLAAGGVREDRKGPLFRAAIGRTGKLSDGPMSRTDVWYMVRRRAVDAELATAIGCHTFRATGITDYLTNRGKLEVAQRMAGHANAKTTGLYDAEPMTSISPRWSGSGFEAARRGLQGLANTHFTRGLDRFLVDMPLIGLYKKNSHGAVVSYFRLQAESTPCIPLYLAFPVLSAQLSSQFCAFGLLSLCIFAASVTAQIASETDTTSTPVPNAGHDYIQGMNETVNTANGSLSIRIGVPIPPRDR